MAELGPRAHRTSDIAAAPGLKVSSIGPILFKLIKKGMIQPLQSLIADSYTDIRSLLQGNEHPKAPCYGLDSAT